MKIIYLNMRISALLIFVLIIFARCGAQIPLSIEPTSGTFTSVYSIIKSNNCVSCHTPTGAATVDSNVALDFTSEMTAYSTITTQNVTGAVAEGTCGSVKIATSGSPTNSYLAGILFSDYNTSNFAGVNGCTPVNTHISMFNLSIADKRSITTWITQGLRNN